MKQTAVNWLVHQLSLEPDGWMKDLIEEAKELEHKHQEELLIWVYSMFTKDAPLEYVLSEFNKLKNK